MDDSYNILPKKKGPRLRRPIKTRPFMNIQLYRPILKQNLNTTASSDVSFKLDADNIYEEEALKVLNEQYHREQAELQRRRRRKSFGNHDATGDVSFRLNLSSNKTQRSLRNKTQQNDNANESHQKSKNVTKEKIQQDIRLNDAVNVTKVFSPLAETGNAAKSMDYSEILRQNKLPSCIDDLADVSDQSALSISKHSSSSVENSTKFSTTNNEQYANGSSCQKYKSSKNKSTRSCYTHESIQESNKDSPVDELLDSDPSFIHLKAISTPFDGKTFEFPKRNLNESPTIKFPTKRRSSNNRRNTSKISNVGNLNKSSSSDNVFVKDKMLLESGVQNCSKLDAVSVTNNDDDDEPVAEASTFEIKRRKSRRRIFDLSRYGSENSSIFDQRRRSQLIDADNEINQSTTVEHFFETTKRYSNVVRKPKPVGLSKPVKLKNTERLYLPSPKLIIPDDNPTGLRRSNRTRTEGVGHRIYENSPRSKCQKLIGVEKIDVTDIGHYKKYGRYGIPDADEKRRMGLYGTAKMSAFDLMLRRIRSQKSHDQQQGHFEQYNEDLQFNNGFGEPITENDPYGICSRSVTNKRGILRIFPYSIVSKKAQVETAFFVVYGQVRVISSSIDDEYPMFSKEFIISSDDQYSISNLRKDYAYLYYTESE